MSIKTITKANTSFFFYASLYFYVYFISIFIYDYIYMIYITKTLKERKRERERICRISDRITDRWYGRASKETKSPENPYLSTCMILDTHISKHAFFRHWQKYFVYVRGREKEREGEKKKHEKQTGQKHKKEPKILQILLFYCSVFLSII